MISNYLNLSKQLFIEGHKKGFRDAYLWIAYIYEFDHNSWEVRSSITKSSSFLEVLPATFYRAEDPSTISTLIDESLNEMCQSNQGDTSPLKLPIDKLRCLQEHRTQLLLFPGKYGIEC